MEAVRTKSATDARHEAAQQSNLARLLKEAALFAKEAQQSLLRSQKLKLASESNVSPGDGSARAASEFEGANHELSKSSSFTHRALDARSKVSVVPNVPRARGVSCRPCSGDRHFAGEYLPLPRAVSTAGTTGVGVRRDSQANGEPG